MGRGLFQWLGRLAIDPDAAAHLHRCIWLDNDTSMVYATTQMHVGSMAQ
jgi:hypothetical protein